MSTATDTGQVILDRIAARQVARAHLDAQDAVDMLAYQDHCRAQAQRHSDARVRDMEVSFAADEIGVVTHQPPRTVQIRLAESRRVRNLMPLTWSAHCEGRIDGFRVHLIASAAAKRTTQANLVHLDAIIGD